jgi:hypothetical protein
MRYGALNALCHKLTMQFGAQNVLNEQGKN